MTDEWLQLATSFDKRKGEWAVEFEDGHVVRDPSIRDLHVKMSNYLESEYPGHESSLRLIAATPLDIEAVVNYIDHRFAQLECKSLQDLIEAIKHTRKLCTSGWYNLDDWTGAVKQLGEATHAIEGDLHGDTLALIQKIVSSAQWCCKSFGKSYEVRVNARETLGVECDRALELLEGKA